MLRVLLGQIDPRPGRLVLDAGCGDGRLLFELAGTGASTFGVDLSPRALKYAAGFTPEALLSVQDVCSLAFPDACFDTVLLIETLEHIPPEIAGRALAELERVLSAGGRFIATVPTHRISMPPKHFRHFNPEELRSLLGEHFNVDSLLGHDRDSRLYRLLVMMGDNSLWHLRAGYNGLLRRLYKARIESAAPGRARRLIAVCSKKTPL
jgi:SAM-dependent methyltransferase